MVKYHNQRDTVRDTLGRVLARTKNHDTVPFGQKVAEPGEGIEFYDSAGEAWRWDGEAVRTFDARMTDAQAKLADAEAALAQAVDDLAAARDRIDVTEAELSALEQRVTDAILDVNGAAERLDAVEDRLTATDGELSELAGRADAVDEAITRVDSAASAADRRAQAAADDAARAATQAGTAKSAADSAAAAASTAQDRADAANRAALDAAGVAAGKGKVIFQPSKPTGANAARENLWVRTTDGKVHAYNGTDWVEVTDPGITSAAAAASAAQTSADRAKTAADAAQARADQAVADAAAAKAQADKATTDAAAAKAQADKATTDAATANTRYTSLASQLEAAVRSSPQFVKDASFEDSTRWAPSNVGTGGGVVTDANARSGSRVMAFMAGASTAFAYVATAEGLVPVSPGATLRWTVYIRTNTVPATTDTFRFIARSQDGVTSALTSYMPLATWGVTTNGVWTKVTYDWKVPANGWTFFRPGIQGQANTTRVIFDDFTVVDVSDFIELSAKVEDARKAATDAAALAQAAQRDAGTALTSANGKSVVQYGTTAGPPSAAGARAGDTYFRVDAAGSALEQWRWDGAAWAKTTVANELIGNLDAGKITAGTLAAARIAARSLTADKLFVGIGENIVINGDGRAGEGWPGFGRNNNPSQSNGYPGSHWLQGRTTNSSDFFPVDRSGPYRVEYWIRGNVPGAKHYVQIMTQGAPNTSPGNPYVTNNADTPSGGEWQKFSATVDLDLGTTAAAFRLYAQHTNGTTNSSGYTWITGITIRQMQGGELIVDGSITAAKANLNSLAVGLADIITVRAQNVEVTQSLAARVADVMDLAAKRLIVTEEAILQHTTLLGTTVAEQLNVTGVLRGRDAILTGTVDVAQLNVTTSMAAEIVNAMDVNAKQLIVTEDAILNRATVIESLVTPELIAEKINAKEIGAQLIQAEAIETSSATNRGMKIKNDGIHAYDTSGRETLLLNGVDNVLMGRLNTGIPGEARILVGRDVSLPSIDWYPNVGTSHGFAYYNKFSDPLSNRFEVGATMGSIRSTADPGIVFYPGTTAVPGTVGFTGIMRSGGAFRYGQIAMASLGANGYRDYSLSFSSMPNEPKVFTSVRSANNCEMVANPGQNTRTGCNLLVKNLSGRTTGSIVIDWFAVSADA